MTKILSIFIYLYIVHIHMELPLYIVAGLIATGMALNRDGKQERKMDVVDSQIKTDDKTGGNNIYDNSYFQKVREIEDKKVIANFERSFDPINTNIIPHYFNNLNETNIKKIRNPLYDKNLFHRELSRVMKAPEILATKLEPLPNDLTLLNQDRSVEVGGWEGDGPRAVYAEPELNRGWSELVTRPDSGTSAPMTHNNMVPFFGSTSKQNMDHVNRMIDDKLENFTGQFKLDKQHKTEVGTMFAPVQQDPVLLAAPRQLDRYVSNLQSRNNETPFEKVYVGRGLADGYTARPTGGFHNTVRVMPKSIEQLLVNPRTVKEGRVIRGKHNVDKRTLQQKQYKYRQELLVDNEKGQRNFKTTGAYFKPIAIPKYIIRNTTREHTSKEVMGHASEQSGSKSLLSKLLPNFKISLRHNFLNTPYRNASKVEGKLHHNNQQLSYENRPNERMGGDGQTGTQVAYGERGFSYANCKSTVVKEQNYLEDLARATRKQAYTLSVNPSGYTSTTLQKGRRSFSGWGSQG